MGPVYLSIDAWDITGEWYSDIDHKMKMYSIPAELVLNADQTPSSYVSVGKQTMATHGARSVPIKGLTDKRNITLTCCKSHWRILTNADNLWWQN